MMPVLSCLFTNHRSEYRWLLLWVYLLGPLTVFLNPVSICAKDLLEWDRFHAKAALSIGETYSDNIYLTSEGEHSDYKTTISPEISLETVLTERSRLHLSYTGRFDFHHNSDNFRSDHHFGDVYFGIDSGTRSELLLGMKLEDNAQSPIDQDDESKDFGLINLYADLNWDLFSNTILGAGYEHIVRNFEKKQDQRDDYVRDNVRLNFLYVKNQRLPGLIEYRYEQQENDKVADFETKLTYHAVFAGFRWRQDRRLSGTVGFGYFWSEFNQKDAFDGWMTDTDLKYRIGSFTEIDVSAQRGIRVSESATRDTLDYNIFSSVDAALIYQRLNPLTATLGAAYQNREFYLISGHTSLRNDDLYSASFSTAYQFRKWLALSLTYIYRDNQSDQANRNYTENLVQAEIELSI